MIGKTLGHYQITSQLGKGGMGEVYQAKDQKLGRDVAIKVLPDEFARDADRVARFQREAKLLASLNNPNIAAIHGLEEAGGKQFLVMELVEGQTLAEVIAGSVSPAPASLRHAIAINGSMPLNRYATIPFPSNRFDCRKVAAGETPLPARGRLSHGVFEPRSGETISSVKPRSGDQQIAGVRAKRAPGQQTKYKKAPAGAPDMPFAAPRLQPARRSQHVVDCRMAFLSRTAARQSAAFLSRGAAISK